MPPAWCVWIPPGLRLCGVGRTVEPDCAVLELRLTCPANRDAWGRTATQSLESGRLDLNQRPFGPQPVADQSGQIERGRTSEASRVAASSPDKPRGPLPIEGRARSRTAPAETVCRAPPLLRQLDPVERTGHGVEATNRHGHSQVLPMLVPALGAEREFPPIAAFRRGLEGVLRAKDLRADNPSSGSPATTTVGPLND
jgi:hypothetical protein